MSPLTTRCASNITPTSVTWLLPDWLPAGKIVILDGAPGVGKSTLTCDLAARLSRGEFNGGPGVTVFITLEDDAEDTIVPRLAAAGADMSRVEICSPDDFELPAHAGRLRATIEKSSARLVVIDPISDFLGRDASMMGDQSIRRALRPLGRLARATGCTIMVVRHLRKREGGPAVYRGLGSIGLVAKSRVAWLLGHHPSGEGRRVLTVSKTNLGEQPPAKVFRVAGGRLQWESEPNWLTPEDVRSAGEPTQAEWLRAQLSRGPKKAKEIVSEALVLGLSERTLRRAKAAAQVVSKQYGGEWYWCLPGQDPEHLYCGLPPREDPYLLKSELEPVPGGEPIPLVGPGVYDPPAVQLRKAAKVLKAAAKRNLAPVPPSPPRRGGSGGRGLGATRPDDLSPPSPQSEVERGEKDPAPALRPPANSSPPNLPPRTAATNAASVPPSPRSIPERNTIDDKSTTKGQASEQGVEQATLPSQPVRPPGPPLALEVTADLEHPGDDCTIRAAQLVWELDRLDRNFDESRMVSSGTANGR